MSFQETMDRRRSGANAIFHRFRTAIKPGDDLHIFVEGYDDVCLYDKLLSDLKGLFGVHWHTHICLGKKNMDRIVQLLNESAFKDRNVRFIRDSDFDRFLGNITSNDSLFLTCGYSVENYVCTSDVLQRFFRSNFGVDPLEVDVAARVQTHLDRVARMFDWLSPTIGAAIFAVREGIQLDLNRLPVSDIYKILQAGEALPAGFEEEDLHRAGILQEYFNAESAAQGTAFAQQDAMAWLRGKYLLECTSEFLIEERQQLASDYRAGRISRFNRRSSQDNSPAAVFERLCATAPGSTELRRFLQRGLRLPVAQPVG